MSTTSANSLTVDFTVNVSSSALSTNGGYIIQNGVIIERINSGAYIAVDAACAH